MCVNNCGGKPRGVKKAHLSSQVLQHSCQVDRGTGTDASGVLALLKETGNTTHWELQTRLRGLAYRLLGSLAFTASRHDC